MYPNTIDLHSPFYPLATLFHSLSSPTSCLFNYLLQSRQKRINSVKSENDNVPIKKANLHKDSNRLIMIMFNNLFMDGGGKKKSVKKAKNPQDKICRLNVVRNWIRSTFFFSLFSRCVSFDVCVIAETLTKLRNNEVEF